jgi:hypothetical protein
MFGEYGILPYVSVVLTSNYRIRFRVRGYGVRGYNAGKRPVYFSCLINTFMLYRYTSQLIKRIATKLSNMISNHGIPGGLVFISEHFSMRVKIVG